MNLEIQRDFAFFAKALATRIAMPFNMLKASFSKIQR